MVYERWIKNNKLNLEPKYNTGTYRLHSIWLKIIYHTRCETQGHTFVCHAANRVVERCEKTVLSMCMLFSVVRYTAETLTLIEKKHYENWDLGHTDLLRRNWKVTRVNCNHRRRTRRKPWANPYSQWNVNCTWFVAAKELRETDSNLRFIQSYVSFWNCRKQPGDFPLPLICSFII